MSNHPQSSHPTSAVPPGPRPANPPGAGGPAVVPSAQVPAQVPIAGPAAGAGGGGAGGGGGSRQGLVPTYALEGKGVEELTRTEWLLTNGLGGFAMGTASGVMTRRYHALLCPAMSPPGRRVVALSSVQVVLITDPGTGAQASHDLSCYWFRPGQYHPRGDRALERFEKDTTCRWHYRVGEGQGAVGVVAELALERGANRGAMRYVVSGDGRRVRLVMRPLVALRDFHGLILRDTAREWFVTEAGAGAASVRSPAGVLHMRVDPAGSFGSDEQWWYNFQYESERDRGYDYLEDLYAPGVFVADLTAERGPGQSGGSGGGSVVGAGNAVTLTFGIEPGAGMDVPAVRHARQRRLEALIHATLESLPPRAAKEAELPALIAASDDFVVRRGDPSLRGGGARNGGASPVAVGGAGPAAGPGAGLDRASVIAGYPWFSDWGRDAMISLPGLLLITGRHAEALNVLRCFGGALNQGLIPNLFDDTTGTAYYNTVDASLWFVHAACVYRATAEDPRAFEGELLPVCMEVIEHYTRGTHFGIRVDPSDGLIAAGDASLQLTWMDAKRDGVTFTPRHGKAVEINALWHHALGSLVEALRQSKPRQAAQLEQRRARVGDSFRERFWNPAAGCLYDALTPAGGAESPQGEVRPNQVFAASLRFSPLTPEQRAGVVGAVRRVLLTGHGVRTLDPSDSRFRGRYEGRMFERDAAYHNGTAWPWLLGPLAEAVLRAGDFSARACAEARAILGPTLASLRAGCLGQLPEVYDGEDTPERPQRPGGSPAQAWSVAECLRAMVMILRAESGQTDTAPTS